MIKALIFDCFGVLVGNGFKNTYAQAGGDPVRDKTFIDEVLVSASRGQITSEEMNQQVASSIGVSSNAWRDAVAKFELPNPELMHYLNSLRGRYKLAILSNSSVGALQRRFKPEQLDMFDTVVVSAEVGMIKPDEVIYRYTAKKLGVKPQECVFVDDNEGNCRAAQDTGMQAIWYIRDISKFKSDLDQVLSHT